MTAESLRELTAQESRGRVLKIRRRKDIAAGSYELCLSGEGIATDNLQHPDAALPFGEGQWGTVVLEEVAGDVPDPHGLLREARRVATERVIIVQRLGEGRGWSRLRQIAARHADRVSGKVCELDGAETAIIAIELKAAADEETKDSALERIKRRVVLKVGAPSARPESYWGDIHYAEGFRRALEAAGNECEIQYLPEWEEGDEKFDVVVHIKGLSKYRAKPCHINVMWMINHPELHRPEELEGYDGILVASKPYTEYLAKRAARPIEYCPQAVEAEGYARAAGESGGEAGEFDIVFVGNNHQRDKGKMRDGVAALLEAWKRNGKRWKVGLWGSYWEEWVPKEWIQGESVSGEEAARIYRRAKIVLNDHHPDMKSYGFINERTLIIGASGGFQICDKVKGIEELPVVYFEDAKDLGEKIEKYLADPRARAEKTKELGERVSEEYSFARSVEQLERLLGRIRKREAEAEPGPLVTVVATTYNRKELLERALRSVVEQSLGDWEMILVNDGGEEVAEVVVEISDRRIRYIRGEHGGKGHALNTALRLARGRYVAYLDDDDYFLAEHLAKLAESLGKHPAAGMVYSDYEEVWEEVGGGRPVELKRNRAKLERLTPFVAYGLQHMTVMHYRSLLEEAGIYDEELPIFIDWDMTQRLALASRPRHVPEATIVHTLRVEGGKIAADHIHTIRTGEREKYFARVAEMLARASERMEAEPAAAEKREEYASLMRRIEQMVNYLQEAGEPRREAAFRELARAALREAYLSGVKEGKESEKSDAPLPKAGPEAMEFLASIDDKKVLIEEIERLKATADEQWEFIERVRRSPFYRIYRRLKSLGGGG